MEKVIAVWGATKWVTVLSAFFVLQVGPEQTSLWAKLASLGLAGVIFWFYRQDRKDSEKRYEDIAKEHVKIVKENTAAVTQLTTVIGKMPCSKGFD